MAQTRGGYELIDDTEVDAESPIVESLMFRLRDQWQGAMVLADAAAAAAGDKALLPQCAKTANLDTSHVLSPDGAGFVQFQNVSASLAAFNASLKTINAPNAAPYVDSVIFSNVGSLWNTVTNQCDVQVNGDGSYYCFFVGDVTAGVAQGSVSLRHNGAVDVSRRQLIPGATTARVNVSAIISGVVATDTLDFYNEGGNGTTVVNGFFGFIQIK